MILSSGERLIWAAVFATDLRAMKEEGYENGPTGETADEEYSICVSSAIEEAYNAVTEARNLAIHLQNRLDGIKEEDRREDDVGEVMMLRAMLGEE